MGSRLSEDAPETMPDATIQTTARVIQVKGDVLYLVSLINGKQILAHLSKRLTQEKASFTEGDELLLEMTPYDFDTARILGAVE